MTTVQALAQHHPETLKTRLHDVCLALIQEVDNLRSAVACAAMATTAELYVNLKKAMDPEVERTGRTLLLKFAQTTNAFVHQEANHALDAMVENCSHGRVLTVLLSTALRQHGREMLQELALHKDFLNLWIKFVPEKDRTEQQELNKLLKQAW